jgi:glycosyltransferase involved in cell wall biosynthesis
VIHEAFALLLPVWDGDRPEYVRRAFRSAVDDQTVRPDQVIVVRDGPVGPDLESTLADLRRTSLVPVTIVALEENVGLGPALNEGIKASWFDVIARMDADDIAMPHRFERQLPLMRNADIVGGGLLEFGADTDDIIGKRTPPTSDAQIREYARRHDPFNHPTVVYRRNAVLDAGGYGDLPLMEDYSLFVRMLENGARAANIAEPLVLYRVGASAESFKRRGGLDLLRSELRLQRSFVRSGFVSRAEYVRNVILRGTYRLIPWWCRRVIYGVLIDLYTERLQREFADALHLDPTDWNADLAPIRMWPDRDLPVSA